MCLDDMGSIWVIKILQAHLLRAFVANSKIDAIYALYRESFCDKNLAIRKVFAFCDSGADRMREVCASTTMISIAKEVSAQRTQHTYN